MDWLQFERTRSWKPLFSYRSIASLVDKDEERTPIEAQIETASGATLSQKGPILSIKAV